MPKLFRVRLVGEGTPESPYRTALPNYDTLLVNYTALWAIVRVPDYDTAIEEPGPNDEIISPTPWGDVVTALSPKRRGRYLEHLKARYRERSNEIDLEVV